jgi:Xaa-Pro aminopeptidase
MFEYELEAVFRFHGARLGLRNVSFLPIVAAGRNSTCLHYHENSAQVRDGDLVLMDCGLFWEHYSGDVTRTFPANGRFSEIQGAVYRQLLGVQVRLIEIVRPGLSVAELVGECQRLIYEALTALGVVREGGSPEIVSFFMPHGLAHGLGCTKHDLARRSSPRIRALDASVLVPGMVISIEPGLYFNRERLKVQVEENREFAMSVNREVVEELADRVGGIRIEDDVLVTEEGREVLSTCPKTVEEIEALFAAASLPVLTS